MAKQPMSPATAFTDVFRDWQRVYTRRNVGLVREFPSIPTRPRMRVSPADLSYDVPPEVDLRAFATDERIDVDVPYFVLPEDRRIRRGYFPLLLRLHSGVLLAVWREASSHSYCPFGRTVAAQSVNGGQSWSQPWVVEFKLPGAWDTGGPENLTQTSDGTLWMSAWGRIPVPRSGTTEHQRAELYALRSHDDGLTWEVFPKLADGFQWHGSPMFEMSNGEFLWLGSAPYEPDREFTAWESTVRAVMVMRQDDEQTSPDTDIVQLGELRFERFGQGQLGGTNESHITETSMAGNLVALMRDQDHGENLYQAFSRDYGRTWTKSKPSDLWYSPIPSQPFLLTLDDGTLVATYGERQNGRIVVIPSFDDGETWDLAHQQVVLDNPDILKYDFSYPQLAEVGGRKLFSIYYNAGHPNAGHNGILGDYIETRFFRDAFHGIQLAELGSVRRAATVGYWRFDEGEGEIAFDDGGPHYGKLFGPTWVRGRFGTALGFDGVDDHVIVTECPTLWVGQEFTIEAWIRTEDPTREQTIVSKLPHYWLGLSEGKLCLRRGGMDGLPRLTNWGRTLLKAGHWYHVAVVVRVTADTIRRAIFYANGAVDANQRLALPRTAEQAQALSDWRVTCGAHWQGAHNVRSQGIAAGWVAQDHLYMGLQHDRKTAPFLGAIDELAIHAEGLTTAEIEMSMSRQRRGSGHLSSTVIKRAGDTQWGRFTAEAQVPAGTRIVYDVVAPDGATLRENISPGEDLSTLAAQAVRLRAELSTADRGHTPTLWSWSMDCEAIHK